MHKSRRNRLTPRPLFREHRLLESKRADLSKFVVQLWKMLEVHAGSVGKPHPSLKAHQALLEVACDRGDKALMADARALLVQRFGANAVDDWTQWNLARGAVLGGSPRMALAVSHQLPTELQLSPKHLFLCVNRIGHLGSLSKLASFAIQRGDDPDQIAEAVTAACVRAVWYESRRKFRATGDYGMTAVPIPSLEKLAPQHFDFEPHAGTRAVAWSRPRGAAPAAVRRSRLKSIVDRDLAAQKPYELDAESDLDVEAEVEVGVETEVPEPDPSRHPTQVARTASIFFGAPRATTYVVAADTTPELEAEDSTAARRDPSSSVEFLHDAEVEATARSRRGRRLQLGLVTRLADGTFEAANGSHVDTLFAAAESLRSEESPGALPPAMVVVGMLADRTQLLELSFPNEDDDTIDAISE